MKIKKNLTLIAALFLSIAACEGQTKKGEMFRPYIPAPIESTGIPACDSYFDQLEVCIKKQLNPVDYKEFQIGITEAKQRVMFFEEDKDRAIYSCNEAKAEAKTKYAGTCTFN